MTNENIAKLKHLPAKDFAMLGLQYVAYVKPVVTQQQVAWSVHAADGSQIAVLNKRDVAFAAVRQQDLEPLSVH